MILHDSCHDIHVRRVILYSRSLFDDTLSSINNYDDNPWVTHIDKFIIIVSNKPFVHDLS